MWVELTAWRPLWDLSAILFVLGAAGGWTCRDKTEWWLSQGLVLLSMIVAFAAVEAMHSDVDVFSLAMWAPCVWLLTFLPVFRGRDPDEEPLPQRASDVSPDQDIVKG